jgi:hypothetical protein
MDKEKNYLYLCENCPFKGDHFKTDDRWKWEKQHLTAKKHNKMMELAESSGIVCPHCECKFTKEGYEFHKRNNKKLHNLIYRRNNHKSFTVYNQDTWQLGYKEYNGHNGENLPKCGIYKAFRKQFGTFEQMEQHIYKKWERYKLEIRNIKMGALPDPWEELSREELAPGGVGDGYESDEWNKEMEEDEKNRAEKELQQKQQWTLNKQLEKFKEADFDVSKIHPDGGYAIDFMLNHRSLKKETMNFFHGLGYYYWDMPRHKIYQAFIDIQSDYPNRSIVYLPEDKDKCLWTGVFFVDYEGEKEDYVICSTTTHGGETYFRFEEEDISSSDEYSDEVFTSDDEAGGGAITVI